MSDFGKSQLLKYGWTEGKGLGKQENGISQAIKPKLKFDLKGVGHKTTEDNWWHSVYNKASQNVAVDDNSSGVSLKTVDENTKIFSKSEDLIEIQKKHSSGYKEFIKTSTLENGRTVKKLEKEDLNNEVHFGINNLQIIDEELFKACEGRTGHKGARHGLNLSGKLARIALQEEEMSLSIVKTENKKKKVRTKKKNIEKEGTLKEESTDKKEGSTDKKEEITKKKEKKEKKRKRKAIDTESEEDIIDEDNKDISHLMNMSKSHKSELTKHQRKTSRRKINSLVEMLDQSFTLKEKEGNKSKCKKTKKKKKTLDSASVDASDEIIVIKSGCELLKDDEYLNSFKDLTFKRYETQNPIKFSEKKHKSKSKEEKRMDKLSDKLNDLCSVSGTRRKKKKKESKTLFLDDDISRIDANKLNSRIEKKKQKRILKDKLKRTVSNVSKYIESDVISSNSYKRIC